MRREDLALPDWEKQAEAQPELRATHATLGTILCDRHFWILAVVVVSINGAWHFFRVWLPLFLSKVHGYSEVERSWFFMAYYLSADVGTIGAGAMTLWLARTRTTVHRSRVVVFLACAVLTTLSAAVAVQPTGPLLIGLLLVIGFGSLGVFPQYYSFSQELTVRHQGKLTGTLGFISWMGVAGLHKLSAWSIQWSDSYALGMTVAGFLPLFAWFVLVLFWRKGDAPGLALHPAVAAGPADEAIRAVDDGLGKL